MIIETPEHDQTLALMTEPQIRDVLRAYQERYRTLREKVWAKLILIFRNHGESAGTSLAHPHSQLIATPVVPKDIRRKYEVAAAYYDDTNRCVYCDLVKVEIELRERVILETERFVVFHPFASKSPFETWIAPKRHQPSFGKVPEEDFFDLSHALKLTLQALHKALHEVWRVLRRGGINVYTVRNTADADYGQGVHLSEDLYEVGGFVVQFFDRDKVLRLGRDWEILGIDQFAEGKLPRKLFSVTQRKPYRSI